jgi:hypothetical protein
MSLFIELERHNVMHSPNVERARSPRRKHHLGWRKPAARTLRRESTGHTNEQDFAIGCCHFARHDPGVDDPRQGAAGADKESARAGPEPPAGTRPAVRGGARLCVRSGVHGRWPRRRCSACGARCTRPRSGGDCYQQSLWQRHPSSYVRHRHRSYASARFACDEHCDILGMITCGLGPRLLSRRWMDGRVNEGALLAPRRWGRQSCKMTLPERDAMPIDLGEWRHSTRSLLKDVRYLPAGWEALCADCHCD